MAKHDENKDLRLVSRIARIDCSMKTITASKTAVIGIRTLGRIDYLTKYCGWHLIYDNSVKVTKVVKDDQPNNNKRAAKKAAKESKLTNKKKK